MSLTVESRVQKCREAMAAQQISALLVTNIDNVRYLTGFTGSSGACLVTPDQSVFITDGRYQIQAAREVSGFEVRIDLSGQQSVLKSLLESTGKASGIPVAIEANTVTVGQLKKWEETTGATFTPCSGLVEDLRMIKDAGEIARIEEAVCIVDATFEHILPCIKPGAVEREIALEIDIQMRRRGAEKPGFDTIVATGPHSAWPHAHPTDRAIEPGDLVTLDFGATCQGYNSDITRTVIVGEAGEKQREIYGVVLDALLKSMAAIRPGIKGKDVDALAREVIGAAGYGDHFTHGLGHSLGRSVHDGPGLSRTAEKELAPGMVLTVEPGIYVEGLGGVRIEDDVVVTGEGCRILTRSPKDLLCV